MNDGVIKEKIEFYRKLEQLWRAIAVTGEEIEKLTESNKWLKPEDALCFSAFRAEIVWGLYGKARDLRESLESQYDQF